jgi:hypothetical protein
MHPISYREKEGKDLLASRNTGCKRPFEKENTLALSPTMPSKEVPTHRKIAGKSPRETIHPEKRGEVNEKKGGKEPKREREKPEKNTFWRSRE